MTPLPARRIVGLDTLRKLHQLPSARWQELGDRLIEHGVKVAHPEDVQGYAYAYAYGCPYPARMSIVIGQFLESVSNG